MVSRKDNRRRVRLGFAFPALVVLLAGGGFVLWGTDIFAIRDISVSGNSLLSSDAIVAAVREEATAPVLGPLHGNFFILPIRRIEERLAHDFPRVQDVSVSRVLRGRTVAVTLSERELYGIYCSTRPPEGNVARAAERCFLMDENGFLFADAPQTEGALLLTVLDGRTVDAALRETPLNPDALDDIAALWRAFREEIQVGTRRLVYEEDVLSVQTLEGWEARFDPQGDIQAQTSALRELLAKELLPAERRDISVIDLTIPGRIYYR